MKNRTANWRKLQKTILLSLVIDVFLMVNTSGIPAVEISEKTIITSTVPSCYQVNNQYSMRVKPVGGSNWTDVPLINHAPRGVLNCTYGNFFFADTVMIEIFKTTSIGTYSISPKSRGIVANIQDTVLSFSLTSPEYLMVTIDDTDILVLAEPYIADPPPVSGPGIFNVTAAPYHADTTGAYIVTEQIQMAIDDASAYSGGTGIVYIPAGVYSITRLNAKSNLEIYLDGGAVLLGTGNPEDYDEYVPGGSTDYTYCIHAEDQENIRIWGPGTIDANGVNLTGLTGPDTQPSDISEATMKIRVLSIHNCSNLTVSNIIAREGSSWTVSFYDSDHIDVDRTKVINERILKHNDGIDLSACQHGRVKDCFVLTSDDAICAKGTDDNNEDCYDIRFEDMVVYSNTRGAKCGMQAYNHMYDIWFKNIDILNARYGIDLLHQDGIGVWEDIHFIDIRTENLQYFVPSSPAPVTASVSTGGPIRNVEITNCSFEEWGDRNSNIKGNINGMISNIIFTNLKIEGELMYNATQARMDLNPFTENILFQVGDIDTIIFPPIDTSEAIEECYSFEPEDFSDQEFFAPFTIGKSTDACHGSFIEIPETRNEPGEDGRIIYPFNVSEEDWFVIWFRVIAADDTDDSFWIRMDGELHRFNNIQQSTDWIWDLVKDSDTGTDPLVFDLLPGEHTLEILGRESHTKLDKVYITNLLTTTPTGCGDCTVSSSSPANDRYLLKSGGFVVTQNPASGYLDLHADLGLPGELRVFNMQGKLMLLMEIDGHTKPDVSMLERGSYLLDYRTGSDRKRQKVILR